MKALGVSSETTNFKGHRWNSATGLGSASWMLHQSTGYKSKNRETAPTENLKILCNKSTNEEGNLQKGRNMCASRI